MFLYGRILLLAYAIYFEQQSVTEVARQKHKTRQAINQTKIKALKKLKTAWSKEKALKTR